MLAGTYTGTGKTAAFTLPLCNDFEPSAVTFDDPEVCWRNAFPDTN